MEGRRHTPTSDGSQTVSEDTLHVPFDTVPETQTDADQRNNARTLDDREKRNSGHDSHSSPSQTAQQMRSNGQDQTSEEVKESVAEESDKQYEVTWDGDDDPMNPKSMRFARKWLIVLLLSGSSLCVTCASSIYTMTYDQLERDFHIGREVATLGLSIFVVGLGLGPMFLAPLSEFYGRRPIYIGAFGMYLVWLIPCAVAKNIATMLVSRFFDGFAGSAFLSVAGGTVGDLFNKKDLSFPMMIYTASPFLGPAVGPIVGGFINQYTSWRWSFYVLIIWAGIQWTAIVFLVPETYHPVLLKRKARKLREETGNPAWLAPADKMNKSIVRTVLWSCIRPFQLLTREPMCMLLCLESAVLLGILYLFFGAFPLIFEDNHGFSESQTGLTFVGILIGMIIGISCDPLWRRNYNRLVRKNGGKSEPEFRLPPTIAGSVIVPVALIGFAFTTYSYVHWVAPVIFSGLFGMGNIFCFGGIFTNHVETYPLYAASALAANSFARSSFAAAFPLFGVQMYETLGYQWASFLLAGLALLLMPFPYLFFKYGKRLRGTSKFAQA